MTVELWIAYVTSQLADAWRHAVPHTELDVLNRLRDLEQDRRVVQLALRRSVIAARLGRALGEVETVRDKRGAIAAPAPGLVLSASHHDDITVLAVAGHARAIGVDIEPTDEADWDTALDEVLTNGELDALESLPVAERQGAYFTCWTLKEAVMKALGEGLSDRDPKSIHVRFPPAPPAVVTLDDSPASHEWQLATIGLDGYVCSVAILGADTMRLELRRWPDCLPPVAR